MAPVEGTQNVVLNPHASGVVARQIAPGFALGFFIQWHWITDWNIAGSHTAEILTNASMHLAFEAGASRVVGVTTRMFTRVVEGRGRVVGVKFKPGALRPFLREPAARFTDQLVPLGKALDVDVAAWEREILPLDDDQARLARVEALLAERLPERDPNVTLLGRALAHIEATRELTRVEELVGVLGVGARTLQRLFSDYVGVGPKWVIRRARLLDGAERLRREQAVNLAELAASLGYFDQAHFAKDFRAIVGTAPNQFRVRANPPARPSATPSDDS